MPIPTESPRTPSDMDPDEAAIRADERRIFADYFDLRAAEIAELADQYPELRTLREMYLDVANTIRFNETAGGSDGHPISPTPRG